jgi:hypothetical protein
VSSERPGIVDLGEVSQMYARQGLAAFYERTGLPEETEETIRFAPPRVVIVYGADAGALERGRDWLSEADHVLLAPAADSDANVAEAFGVENIPYLVQERQEAIARVAGESCDDIHAAIARALALTKALAPRPAMPPKAAPDDELPGSSWIPYVAAFPEFELLERIERHGDSIAIRPPRELEIGRRPSGAYRLGADPVHSLRWTGNRMTVHWHYKGHHLCRSEHAWPCGPARKLYGYEDNNPLQVCLAPDLGMYVERFEHDALVTTVPFAWRRAGDVDIAVRPFDPLRALFFAQDEANDANHPRTDPAVTIDDEDARDLAPAIVLAPDRRYALSLEHRTYRIDVSDSGAALVGGPNEGFAIFEREHTLVRRGRGRLLGGWYRHATIVENGRYFREDLVTGERTLLGPVDFEWCADEAVEAVARDAMLEGDVDRARALREQAGLVKIPTDELRVFALQGTRNILLVTDDYVRVV